MSSGCHKCGGYPGHPSKNRAFLVECMQCGTFTCNNHLTIMGNCPSCQSGKVKKVMTQRDVKQAKRGGMPGSKAGAAKNTKQNKDNRSTVHQQQGGGDQNAGGGTVAFARGGTEVPQSSGGNPGLQYNPADLAPENVKTLAFTVLNEDQQHLVDSSIQGLTNLELDQLGGGVNVNINSGAHTDSLTSNPAAKGQGAATTGEDENINLARHTSDDGKEVQKIIQSKESVSAPTDDEKDEDDLSDLFEDENTAFNFNDNANDTPPPDETNEDNTKAEETTQEEEDDTAPVTHSNGMTADEMAAIEEELAAAAERRKVRMAGLDTVKRLQNIAGMPLKEIIITSDYVDALWGLTSVAANKDIISYQEKVLKLREEFAKNDKLPQFLMGMVGFEPQDDEVLNRTVIDTIKSMVEVYCIIGYGPRSVKYAKPEKLEVQLKSLIGSTDQVLGLGILGLDMHYAPYTIEQQKEILKIQFDLAAELGLLVYINSEKADAELCAFLKSYDQSSMPKLVYAGLLNSDEMAQAVADYDMHLCLRPELTYETNKEALERTKHVNSVRWLPASGMPHSAPMAHSGQWNEISFIPETMNKFFAVEFGNRAPDEFITLCVSNWARLLFSTPLVQENAGKEDIWADFDPNKKLF